MDAVVIPVGARQIGKFSTFSVNSALRHSLSVGCVIAANDMQISWTFLVKTLSSLRTHLVFRKWETAICFN